MRHHVLCLTVLAAASPALAQTPPPTIVVEANYPGASAIVVADTVAAPIEQQLQGLAKVAQMRSRNGNDGSYRLALSFEPGVDLRKVQQLVQERVSRALPMLPEIVNRQGVTTRIRPLGVLMLVALTAPKDRYDALYLSNFSTLNLKGQLHQLPGVAEVRQLGQRDYSMRVWLNPDNLAKHGVTVAEVLEALRQQNAQVGAGQIGQPPVPAGQQFQFPLKAVGRLSGPNEFGETILKKTAKDITRLKDVAKSELGAQAHDHEVLLNGKPAALLSVLPAHDARLGELCKALQARLAELRKKLPEGLQLEVAFDFTASLGKQTQGDEFLRLDVDLPDGASLERIRAMLERCSKHLRDMPDVRDVLALTEDPFDATLDQPSLLVRLAPLKNKSRAKQIDAIRASLEKELPDARLRQRSAVREGYPLHFALHGPDEAKKLRDLAQRLADELQREKRLTDVWVDRAARLQSSKTVQVDRAQLATHGVAARDVFDTLQLYYGSAYVNDFNRFGRTWQVTVQAERKQDAKSLDQLRVRTAAGALVPLSQLVKEETSVAVTAYDRLNMVPMVALSANPGAGVSLAQARKLCEAALAKLSKGKDVRLTWLAR